MNKSKMADKYSLVADRYGLVVASNFLVSYVKNVTHRRKKLILTAK